MSLFKRLGDRLLRPPDYVLSDAERAARDEEQRAKQVAALERAATAEPRSNAPRRPGRKPATVSATPLPALTGGPVKVSVPTGLVKGHPWRPLRPTAFSPLYQQLDEQRLRRLLAERPDSGADTSALLTAISPETVREDKLFYELDGRYYATLAVRDWPAMRPDQLHFGPEMWHSIINGLEDVTVSVHHWRQSQEAAEHTLRAEIEKRELDLKDLEAKGEESARTAQLRMEIEKLSADRQSVLHQHETHYHLSAYLRVSAPSEESLRDAIAALSDQARKMGSGKSSLIQLPGRQRDAYLGSMPFSSDPLYLTRMQGSAQAAAKFPFITRGHTERDAEGREHGVLYGIHLYNATPVVMTPWNANGTIDITSVLGAPGSGKTYWLRTHFGRLSMVGTKVMVIDPLGDFVDWFRNNDGQIINLHADSRHHVNPLQRPFDQVRNRYESINTKVDSLKPLFRMLLGDQYTDYAARLINAALTDFYASFDPAAEEKVMADFLPFLKNLDHIAGEPIQAAALKARDDAYDLLRATTMTGDLAGFFAHPTNVDLSHQRLLFNLKENGKGEHLTFAAYMAVTLSLKAAMLDMQPKLLAIDEIHLLLAAGDSARGGAAAIGELIGGLLAQFNREHRHYNAGITLATQFFDDDSANKAQRSILTSTKTWVLMKGTEPMLRSAAEAVGDDADLDLLTTLLKVTDIEAEKKRVGPREAVIYRYGSPIPIKTVGLPFEDVDDDHASGLGERE